MIQKADQQNDSREQNTLQASNIWQDIQDGVAGPLNNVLIEVHPYSDSN